MLEFVKTYDMKESKPEIHTATIGPDQARYIVEDCFYDKQRGISTNHVSRLARTMKMGEWRDYSDIEIVETPDGKVLVNGYHRLLAVIQSGTTQRFHVKVVSGDKQTVLERYAVHDRGLGRSLGTVYDVTGNPKTPMTVTLKRKLAAAAKVISAGMAKTASNTTRTDMEIVRLIDELSTTAMSVYNIAKINSADPVLCSLYAAHPLATILVAHRGKPEDMKVFLEGVTTGAGLEVSDPRLQLRNYLTMFSPRHESAHYRRTYMELAKVITYCWNSFLSGHTFTKVRVPLSPDREIDGTDFILGSGHVPDEYEAIMRGEA